MGRLVTPDFLREAFMRRHSCHVLGLLVTGCLAGVGCRVSAGLLSPIDGAGPAALKGLTTVFVETSSDYDVSDWLRMNNENRSRIVTTIAESRLGLTVTSRREDASIILVFQYDAGRGGPTPTCTGAHSWAPDRATGEVYVSDANGVRPVLSFRRECSIYRRWLATTFAEAFVRAYREANGTV